MISDLLSGGISSLVSGGALGLIKVFATLIADNRRAKAEALADERKHALEMLNVASGKMAEYQKSLNENAQEVELDIKKSKSINLFGKSFYSSKYEKKEEFLYTSVTVWFHNICLLLFVIFVIYCGWALVTAPQELVLLDPNAGAGPTEHELFWGLIRWTSTSTATTTVSTVSLGYNLVNAVLAMAGYLLVGIPASSIRK